MELLYEPESQKQAFVDACAWAEQIYLCLAWIEPGDAQGPSFADLKLHEGKVCQAIVGLARYQSYPPLLRQLHRWSVLRVVKTVDWSFAPNFYLFRYGSRVRVLLASAPFTSTRFARACESLVVFEGDRDDPFALQASRLLERCQASAHVPRAADLDAYEDAWAAVRSGGREPEAIAGLPLETYDATALGTLALEREPGAVLEAFVGVRNSLSRAAAITVAASLLPRGVQPHDAALQTTLYWSSLGVWGAIHRSGTRYWLHFGLVPPWEVVRPTAAVSLVAERIPLALNEPLAPGELSVMAIARAKNERRFLVHLLADPADYTFDVEVGDTSGTRRAAIVGQSALPTSSRPPQHSPNARVVAGHSASRMRRSDATSHTHLNSDLSDQGVPT
jgi:hypothetical protein